MDNVHQGVWIDDVIIGLAERGEMVVNAPADGSFLSNFIDNQELLSQEVNYLPQQQILVGEYELEIRRGIEYASWAQRNPIPVSQQTPPYGDPAFVSGPVPGTMLYKSIDSNDRVAQQTSFIASELPIRHPESRVQQHGGNGS